MSDNLKIKRCAVFSASIGPSCTAFATQIDDDVIYPCWGVVGCLCALKKAFHGVKAGEKARHNKQDENAICSMEQTAR